MLQVRRGPPNTFWPKRQALVFMRAPQFLPVMLPRVFCASMRLATAACCVRERRGIPARRHALEQGRKRHQPPRNLAQGVKQDLLADILVSRCSHSKVFVSPSCLARAQRLNLGLPSFCYQLAPQETIGPDPHSPGSALPPSAYAADVGYLVDGTPIEAAGNNAVH